MSPFCNHSASLTYNQLRPTRTTSANLHALLQVCQNAAFLPVDVPPPPNPDPLWPSSLLPSTSKCAASPDITMPTVCKSRPHPVGGRTHKSASAWPPGGRLRSRPSPGEPGRLGSGSPADEGGTADVTGQKRSKIQHLT